MMLSKTFCRNLCYSKFISRSRCYSSKSNNPFSRTWNVISNDMRLNQNNNSYPEHADVVIIGGGFIGASVAYWLKIRAGAGLSVVILEKDLSYADIQNNMSLGTLSQHFSLPENIYLSQHSNEFLRNIKTNLDNNINIEFCPNGYLVLASDKYAERLEQNVALQKEYGIKNELLTTAEIQKKYPWINISDVKLGCISSESEGHFNPWALLKGLLMKCKNLGVNIVNAEVTGFEMEKQRDMLMEGVSPGEFKRINKVVYKTNDNEELAIKFALCILAAGDKSSEIGKFADIGNGEGLLNVSLPIERREYNVYSLEDDNLKTSINTPYIMDTSGLWLRRNGIDRNLICGMLPLRENNTKELLTDTYYTNVIKPSIKNRYFNCKEDQIKKIKTEFHDCNTYDESGIVGPHPYHTNLIIAAGFGKLGCQHAPGIGRAVAELIIDGHYCTIDLTRLGFDRLLVDEPLVEFNMY